jgi:hypothetical protein
MSSEVLLADEIKPRQPPVVAATAAELGGAEARWHKLRKDLRPNRLKAL